MHTDARSASRHFVHMLWDCEISRCTSYLAKDFSFVGPFNNTIGFGISQFIQYCRRIEPVVEQLSFSMDAVKVAQNSSNSSTVLVVSEIFTQSNRPVAHGRYTFVWHKNISSIELLHLHVSIPLLQRVGHSMHSLILSSNNSAKEADHAIYGKPVSVRDTQGMVHLINGRQTIYLESSHQYTVIHLKNEKFRVRRSLTNLLSQLPSCFVRIHRSYAVNSHLVTSIKGPLVTLTSGDTINIPTKRVKEMRTALEKAAGEPATLPNTKAH